MSTPLLDMSSVTGAVFRSTDTTGGISAYTEKIRYISFKIVGSSSEDRETRIKSAIAMAYIRSKNQLRGDDEPEDALAYILTVTYLLFPEMEANMRSSHTGNYVPVVLTISAAEFESLIDANKAAEAVESEEESNEGDDHVEKTVEIPEIDAEISIADLLASTREVAGRWGVEIMPIGKNVSLNNMTFFRTKRMTSIKGALGLKDKERHAFSDEHLATYEVLQSVERAFNVFPAVRLGYATYWVNKIVSGSRTSKEEAFLTLFRMTEGFGFASPNFITDFLHAYPAAMDFQETKPAVSAFLIALRAYLEEPPRMRGYLKVRFGSNHKLFSGASRGAILALAVAYRTQTEASAKNLINIDPYMGTITRFNKFLEERGLQPINLTSAGTATININEA